MLSWIHLSLNEYNFSGAFYSFKLAPNFRVISLNTNYCPKENFWLFLNSTDPLGQLEWLVNTLQECENNNEKVGLIFNVKSSSFLNLTLN